MNDRLPDHSSLTRNRQRRGADRFRRIFERTVKACFAAGIANGKIVHVDGSLIRADVAWESRAVRHAGVVAEVNGDCAPDREGERALRDSRKTGKFKKVCLADPDASMATSGRNRRLEPSYKQHGIVDDPLGVLRDVEVTTGEVNAGEQMPARRDAAAAMTGAPIAMVTADAGYAYAKICAAPMSSAFGHSLGPMAVMPSRPNEDSIIRLIGAVLFEQIDAWQTASRLMMVEAFAHIDAAEIDPLLGITSMAACPMTLIGHPGFPTTLTDVTRDGDREPVRMQSPGYAQISDMEPPGPPTPSNG